LIPFPGRHHGFFNDSSFNSSQNDGDYDLTIGYVEEFLLKWGYLMALQPVTNFGTGGIYGEASASGNAVDVSIGDKNVATFAIDLQNAFNAGNGGDVNFEAGFRAVPSNGANSNNPMGHAFDFKFGSNKSIRVTSSLDYFLYSNDINNQVNSLSGTNSILPGTFTNSPTANFTWVLGSVRNGSRREGVTELALTCLSRTTYPSTGAPIDVTAHFSGGQATTLSGVIGNTRGTSDTFFHFTAPTNEWIQSVDFTNEMAQADINAVRQARLAIDDVAFVTSVLPELQLRAELLSNSGAEVGFLSGNGQVFRLERSTNLTDWTITEPCLTGTGGLMTVVDTNAEQSLQIGGQVFYRIGQE